MQITLSSQQSQILESLSQQGGYSSIEEAIDTDLLLLADEIMQQSSARFTRIPSLGGANTPKD
ncbi:MAG: hypothetical protein PUP91_01895 [Rhizonema sp. PD37]|nr:hypothetical protein [Rhizonema sp. PD37]